MRSKCFLLLIFFLLLGNLFNLNADNLIKNGTFDGQENWSDYYNDAGKGTVKIENSTAVVTITNPGKFYWSIGYCQVGITLEKDYIYQVSFSAKSDSIKQIRSLTQFISEPYYGYSGSHSINITNKMKKYTYTFTMRRDTDKNASIQFQMGSKGKGVVYIDDVSIIKIGKKQALKIPQDFPKPRADKILRGITFGNTLDAPLEGDWAPELQEDYFKIIAESGKFDHIRIPIRWESHTNMKTPYKIDSEFLKRVDWAVSNSLKNGLYVVINMHHHHEFENNPGKNMDKFLSMWSQIAEYFKKYPDNLYFEIYNEPGSRISGDKSNTIESPDIWNKVWIKAYKTIRETNPDRKIIITGPIWANIDTLSLLKLPKDVKNDPNIIIKFHLYYPAKFCFQGSPGNMLENENNIRWKGSKDEKAQITRRIKKIKKWAEKNNINELWNGEFCAHDTGGSLKKDRLKWTNFIVNQCEENDIAWCYWDFHGDSARVYDIHENKWDEDLIKALTRK